jgi:class 3 adenylate cyclase
VTVFISLFRYLRLMLFLTVSILAIGANLPDQLAAQLGISQLAMIVASGVLVLVSLLYKLYQLRPPEKSWNLSEETVCTRHDTINSRNDVIAAIVNGNFSALHGLLLADVEINFSQSGHVPLFLAIEKGYTDIVLLLLFYGAKIRVRNKEGKTPLEFALMFNNMRVAEIIHYASRQNLGVRNSPLFANQQTNNVAVLFADICGSTALYEKLGNEAALAVITRTLNILTQEVATHKGTLIKTIGDEIMCSFPSVAMAAQAACAMQFAIEAQHPGGEQPIYVRIGFHYGEVIHKGSDLFGDTVNVAARVAGITRARQILTTQAVVDALPSGFSDKIRPIMRAAFRGKQDSFGVFQILWEPDNSLLDRIGQTVFRKRQETGDALLIRNPAVPLIPQPDAVPELIPIGIEGNAGHLMEPLVL